MAMNRCSLKVALSVFCLALLAWIISWRHLVLSDLPRQKITVDYTSRLQSNLTVDHTSRLQSDGSLQATHDNSSIWHDELLDDDLLEEKTPPSRWLILPRLASPLLCSQLAQVFPDWQLLVLDVRPAESNESMASCPIHPFNASRLEEAQGLSPNYSPIMQAAFSAIQGGAEMLYIAPQKMIHSVHDIPLLYVDMEHRGLVTAAQNLKKSVTISDYYGCGTHSNSLKTSQNHIITKKFELKPHKIPALQIPVWRSCGKASPPITVQEGLFLSDVVIKGGLFHRSSFWSLPVLEVNSLLEAGTWSLLIQKLLWIVGDKVMLTNGYATRNVHKHPFSQSSATFANPVISSLNKQHKKLMQTLQSVNCNVVDFYSCLLVLINYGERLTKDIFVQKEIFLTWITELRHAGWDFPLINDSTFPSVSHSTKYQVELIAAGQIKLSQNTSVILNCDAIERMYTDTCGANISSVPNQSNKPLHEMSQHGKRTLLQTPSLDNRTLPLVLSSDTRAQDTPLASEVHEGAAPGMDDILLVVAFNNPHYEALPYVELLYRATFPHILYCGPGRPQRKRFPGLSRFHFSFVSYGSTPEGHLPGSFNYECLALAAGMRFNVRGYLLIGDDVLLLPHNLVTLSPEHVWFLPTSQVSVGHLEHMEECFMGACDAKRELIHLSYRSQTTAALHQLKQNSGQQDTLSNCYHTLFSLVGENKFFTSYADVAYIPSRLGQDFQKLVQVFRQEEVFLEVALPTILMCLEPFKNVIDFPGKTIWDSSRNQPWLYINELYKKQLYFLHPAKWGFLMQGDSNFTQFYCDVIQHEGTDKSLHCL